MKIAIATAGVCSHPSAVTGLPRKEAPPKMQLQHHDVTSVPSARRLQMQLRGG